LTDEVKISFIKLLSSMLTKTGKILLGDVSFETRDELEECKEKYNKYWDSNEVYFIAEEIKRNLVNEYFCEYTKISQCAGVLTIANK
jgi:putative AdoMet-dependent methyltransferase